MYPLVGTRLQIRVKSLESNSNFFMVILQEGRVLTAPPGLDLATNRYLSLQLQIEAQMWEYSVSSGWHVGPLYGPVVRKALV